MNIDMEVTVILIAFMVVIFGVPWIMKMILQSRGIPHIPKEFEPEKAQVVCKTNTYLYSFIVLISGLMGVVLIYMSIGLALEGELAGMAFSLLAIAFIAIVVFAIVIMKNKFTLLFPDRVIYRDTFGKVFYYTTQQVVGYVYVHGSKQRYLRVRMCDNKSIYIEDDGKTFYDAMDFVKKHYPEL